MRIFRSSDSGKWIFIYNIMLIKLLLNNSFKLLDNKVLFNYVFNLVCFFVIFFRLFFKTRTHFLDVFFGFYFRLKWTYLFVFLSIFKFLIFLQIYFLK